MQKAVTSAEDSGIASTATTVSPTRKRQDLASQNVNKDKKSRKGQRGQPIKKSDDKNDGSGNSKRNNDTTPKKIVVIKDKNKDANSTTASPTPALTHQRVQLSKKANGDTASTHEIDSEEGELRMIHF